MSGVDSRIGKYIREIINPKVQRAIKDGEVDLNGDKKISPDEKVDTDGNKIVDDAELGAFYIKNKTRIFKPEVAEQIDQQLGVLTGQGVQAPIETISDQRAIDAYLSILLDQNYGYEERIDAARVLISAVSQGKSTKEVREKFAELYKRNIGSDIELLGKEDRVQRAVYNLLIKEKSTVPFGIIFYSAVGWRWKIETPKDENVDAGVVKRYAEALYEIYKKGPDENRKEINNIVSRLDVFTKMWFIMKAAGDKGVDKAIEDHDFGITYKSQALKILLMTINEKDEKLVTPDLRKGAFELYLRLAGKIPMKDYIDKVVKLLNFEGMEKYVVQKLLPVIKEEIAAKEKEFNAMKDRVIGKWLGKETLEKYAYKQSAGWWFRLQYGYRDSWNPLDEYNGTVFDLKRSDDTMRHDAEETFSTLGRVSALEKLISFIISAPNKSVGRRAEVVFREILEKLSTDAHVKLFRPEKLIPQIFYIAEDPGEKYKIKKPIPGTFGFETVDTWERKPYNYTQDFVISYYHFKYMSQLFEKWNRFTPVYRDWYWK